MRLIDADALEKALHNFFDGKVIDEPAYILRDVFCHIDNAPTVKAFTVDEVEEIRQATMEQVRISCKHDERPHGEWKHIVEEDNDVECPFCGFQEDGIYYNYCPSCGADMQKGGAE